MIGFMNRLITLLTASIIIYCSSAAATELKLQINYLKFVVPQPPVLSNKIIPPANSGLKGAVLAINDSNITGKFLQQRFKLNYIESVNNQDFLNQLSNQYQLGHRFFILNTPLAQLKIAAQWAQGKNVILINSDEASDQLRHSQCLLPMLHTAPSNAMKSDALAQWLLHRRLNKVLLIHGKKTPDLALVKSFQRAAKRFGIKIIEQKAWDFNTDLRRSAQQEIPLFTQIRKDYDVVYVADSNKDFAEYLPFNTYLPRPVIGSAGLEPLAWHFVIEQWGAAQLQNRFKALAQRVMNESDFNGYLAVRSIAQAVHQTNNGDPNKLLNFIHSDLFELAAYKGRKLSYRAWNGQLRMPIALVQPHALVSQSPQTGVLHPVNELDTLGYDQQESHCR